MALRQILTVADPVLRRKARRVNGKQEIARLQSLFDDMIETMREAPGVGLAATQIGVPLRVAVIEIPPDDNEPLSGRPIVLVNPEIIRAEGEEESEEACLSVPNLAGQVPRAAAVTVRALDRHGRKMRIEATGFLARVLQHEIDHLDGIVFVDRVAGPDKIWRYEPQPEKDKERTSPKHVHHE